MRNLPLGVDVPLKYAIHHALSCCCLGCFRKNQVCGPIRSPDMLSETCRESIMALWGLSTYFGKQQALTQVRAITFIAPCDAAHADGNTHPPLGAAPLCVPNLLCSVATW